MVYALQPIYGDLGMVYDIVLLTVWKIFLFLDLPTYHGDFPWREKITTRQQLCTWRVTSGVTTIGLWLSSLDWPKKKHGHCRAIHRTAPVGVAAKSQQTVPATWQL